MQHKLISKVAIIIPCYKATNKVGTLCNQLIKIASELSKVCSISVYIIDDFCPEMSYKEVPQSEIFKVINNKKNLGVGFSSLVGFKEALKSGNQFFIKMDADGQHPPEYLLELVPYLLNLSNYELVLVKGTRYHYPIKNRIPFDRKLGSFLLEPLARLSLIYKGLTDIANGFIATNRMTLDYLLTVNTNTKIFSRYLFESSLLEKSCLLRCQIYQFPMSAKYGKKWRSSMESRKMIFPILSFWSKVICRRIFNQYFFNLNLGTLLLTIFALVISYVIYTLLYLILPSISLGIFVSAGVAASFTSMITVSSICLCLFFFYDYSSGQRIKIINFKYYLDDILLEKDSD